MSSMASGRTELQKWQGSQGQKPGMLQDWIKPRGPTSNFIVSGLKSRPPEAAAVTWLLPVVALFLLPRGLPVPAELLLLAIA